MEDSKVDGVNGWCGEISSGEFLSGPVQLEKRNSYFTRISILPDIDVHAIRLEEFHSRDVSELRNGILAFRNR